MAGQLCFLGVDVGTQGVRVALVGLDGRAVAAAARPLTSSRRVAGTHEQRPQEWWDCLVAALREALGRAGGGIEVGAVALDSTSGTVLVESGDGGPVGPALMYDDGRAVAEARRADRGGRDLWDALGYRMQPTWALPKVLWLVQNADLKTGDRVVHQADHLVRRLVGHPVATDTSHALKTGVDLRTAGWPEDVFTELGLAQHRLPHVVLPGTVLGRVGAEGTRLTGLRQGTPVRAGMTDGCAAQIASGAMRPGSWSSALGTTLVVKGASEQLIRDPAGSVYCHRHPDGGWLPGGASSSGAGVLTATFGDDADLDGLTRQASRRPPVAGISYPLVGGGERFPFVAPDARGFVSTAATDDVDRFAALCQAVAYVERLAYDVLGLLGADTSGPVSLTGGATRNRWWNQLRTDVLGRVTSRPISAEAAVGMAILAAAEPRRLTETAEAMVVLADRFEPDEQRGAAHHDGYVRLVEHLATQGWLDEPLARSVLGRVGASR